MSRIKRLIQPDTQALNWKAAIPVLALAVACIATVANAQTSAEPKMAAKSQGRLPAVVDFKDCKKPVWPAEALKNEITGTVTLEFLISAEGKPIESRVAKSSGDASLDEAARTGIMLCHFKPGLVEGKPVESRMMMQYVWTLH